MKEDIKKLQEIVREMAKTTSKLSDIIQHLIVEDAIRRMKNEKH